MWGTRHLVLTAAIVTVSVTATTPARANTARRVALLGSDLITDDTDVFLYPGAVGFHRNLVVLNLGLDPFDGDGGIIFGFKKLTIGAFAHRVNAHGAEAGIPSDLEEMLELYGDSGAPLQYEIPAKLFDLLVALQILRGVHLGLDVGLAHSFSRIQEGSGTSKVLTGEHTYALSFVLGLSAQHGSWRNDLSLELSWNRIRDVQADVLAARSRPQPSFTLADRLIVGIGHKLGWGLSVLLSRRDYGISMPVVAETWDSSRWIFRLGAGPRVEITGMLVASLEVFAAADLTMMVPDWEVPTEEEDAVEVPRTWQRWNVLIPGVRISAEFRPVSWIVFRAALEDQYRLNWQDDTGAFTTANSFAWSLGFGLAWKSFVFDAAIAHSLFTEGPYFITGRSAGLFSQVSVAYDW